MKYFFEKTIDGSFETAKEKITKALKEQGFGILTEIDLKTTLKNKLDVEFKPYTILGACNPNFAYQALQKEDKIGLMLPCNVIVQDAGGGKTTVAAVDPVISMKGVENPDLEGIASEVRQKLQFAIEAI